MPGNMAEPEEKDPIFVMNSLADKQRNEQRYLSEESLDNSTTSSTESEQARKTDHDFIPTRMKTIAASKPAADPKQFTRIPSNPLLISAQKQLMQVEEVKKKKEVIHKRGDDEPDWQNHLSSWKDRRRKQSEETLQRVAEVKAFETEEDGVGQGRKLSIGKKLSGLLHNDEDDWSDLGLEKIPKINQNNSSEISSVPAKQNLPKETKKRTSLPATIKENQIQVTNDEVKSASRTPGGYFNNDGYGEGVPVLNRKTSAPVLPYGNSGLKNSENEKEPPPVRRKSSELSSTMKSRLEAFTKQEEEEKNAKKMVEPDNTFREKLQTFRKISEPQPEEEMPKGPKPVLSYKTLIGNNFASSQQQKVEQNEPEDDVDQLLDDALEESYRSVLEEETSTKLLPPTEAPPPPPPPEAEMEENSKNLAKNDNDFIDKQEQEIIASLEKEEREHKKYMDTVNAMRALSPSSSGSSNTEKIYRNVSPSNRNVSPALSNSTEKSPKKKGSSYNQHWLVQEAEQRRISEQQMRHFQQQNQSPIFEKSPVYENSNYIGGMQVPPPSQYTNHQRAAPPQPPVNGRHTENNQPPPNENMYANLGQHPPLPPNFQREIPPGPPQPSSTMRGLPGPQVPPRNPPGGGENSSVGGSSDRLLSVSGKKKCSHCGEELGRGAAMIIESLRLFYHLRCFRCVVCHVQLGNGSTGTDVRVRNNKLHCQNCYSNDEGLKFSKV